MKSENYKKSPEISMKHHHYCDPIVLSLTFKQAICKIDHAMAGDSTNPVVSQTHLYPIPILSVLKLSTAYPFKCGLLAEIELSYIMFCK